MDEITSVFSYIITIIIILLMIFVFVIDDFNIKVVIIIAQVLLALLNVSLILDGFD